MRKGRRFRWLQRGLLGCGVLLLAIWSGIWIESERFQSAESAELDAEVRADVAGPRAGPSSATFFGPLAPARSRPAADREKAIGRIEIPRLGITAIVAEGVDSRTLRHAVGHVPSTALPGRAGNCALAGHRDTFLRGLGRVRARDTIRVVTRERTYRYRVEWGVVVDPHRVDLLDPTPGRSLTLITCYPFEFIGHAPQRFVVRAIQVDADENPAADQATVGPKSRAARSN